MVQDQIRDLLQSQYFELSNMLPSEWIQSHRVMGSDQPFPGPFDFKRTPYAQPIVDCFSPTHPAKIIAVMKGLQIGISSGVIEAAISWAIGDHPCHILATVGHETLVEKTMKRIDDSIDSCGLRQLIRPSALRKRNQRTGDTNTSKEFPFGSLSLHAATNDRIFHGFSVQMGFIDDYDEIKQAHKASGSIEKAIEGRFAAYYHKMKLGYFSTPQLKSTSNIEAVFNKGDQQYWNIPCQRCGTMIPLLWTVKPEGGGPNDRAGMVWKEDNGRVKKSSVEYICQSCGHGFNDKNKYEFLLAGKYFPTAEPQDEDHCSFHISSLYAPAGMYDWLHYVRQFVEACPTGQPVKEHLYKSFLNLCLGLTFEPSAESPKATIIMKNTQDYEIGIAPEKLSMQHGNGRIVLITCAADLNGKMAGFNSEVNDARLDWQVVAHTETGSTYNLAHGSIGTFKPLGGNEGEVDRKIWTYEHNKPNSVWPEFEKILARKFKIDSDKPGEMPIAITALDCGVYATTGAYPFLDKTTFTVVGVKGNPKDNYLLAGKNTKIFKKGLDRANLYILEVGILKDRASEYMNLRCQTGEPQPEYFMNFPHPGKDPFTGQSLYEYNNFFSHFEAEHRTEKKDVAGNIEYKWEKKDSSKQNHMWDCFLYDLAVRDIFVSLKSKEWKVPELTWQEYVEIAVKMLK